MSKVYADNSATSYPKAPGVSDAMKDFIDNSCCNINRGGYELSYDTSFKVLEARKSVSELFNAGGARNVIFTPSVTYSLNMLIKGFLKEGDHALVTSMEHNAVMRPINQSVKVGASFDKIKCAPDGTLNPQDIIALIKPNTKAVIMTHASNVCGTVTPIYEAAEICKKHKIKLIVDAAQTAGVLEIDASNIDALAFTGHKGLLAAQGIGGFIIKDDFAEIIEPLITGGTGSVSHEEIQPNILPDKFESGTLNIPGILGLKQSISYIKSCGINNIFKMELSLTELFLEEISKLQGVKIIGKQGTSGRVAVVSLDFPEMDNAEVSEVLSEKYGIMTRCGLHCAPSAHKTLGTYPAGTVRFSFGHFNTKDEIDYIVKAIKEIIGNGFLR